MANKRMFSLSVVDTDKFLEMPISSRLLYYELGMRADDDGFVDNWKKILLFTGLKEDDLKVLITKQFIIPFESGVIVIRHWRMNNYLQNDRTKPTIHQEELKQLGLDNSNVYNLYTNCIHSIDKYSIDKNSIDKYSIVENSVVECIEGSQSPKETIFDFIEQNFGRTLNNIEVEQILEWEDNELTRYAIKKAVLNGKYNIKYINTILVNYKNNSITTIQQAQEEEEKFKNRKNNKVNNPEWFDKKIDKVQDNGEIEDILKEYK